MTEPKFSRRQFLKVAGLTGVTAAISGCSDANRKLIPYVTAPEDIVPGEATWYATTCRECPAGCGMLAKNRDGRVIKVEGNPFHPVNTGKLCARGQASVQSVYNPDRLRSPEKRLPDGTFAPVSWKDAEKTVLDALASASRKGGGKRILFITDLTTGAERQIVRRLLLAGGSENHVTYEPLSYEALRQANAEVFGAGSIPDLRIDNADFLLSFSADFLDTWVSNVRFSRQFSAFRQPGKRGRSPFFYVGPRLSVTGANADHWIPVAPGGQSVVALGLLNLLLGRNHSPALDRGEAGRLRTAVAGFTPEAIEKGWGVKKKALEALATSFIEAERPLVLAEGLGYQDTNALQTARAAALLNRLAPGSSKAIDFFHPFALSQVARSADMKEWTESIRRGEVDLLFILRTNPVFHLPPEWGFSEALKSVPLVVAIGSFPDETNRVGHVSLPVSTFLESWGDYAPREAVHSLLQPVTGSLFDTRSAGDILLSLGKALKADAFPEKDFYEVVRNHGSDPGGTVLGRPESEPLWQEALRRGGSWEVSGEPEGLPATPSLGNLSFSFPSHPEDKGERLSFISYPTIQFFDGRTANRPFLKELPDPMTAVTWEGWVEINPATAARLAIKKGDLLTIRVGSASVRATAYPYPGIAPDTLAMPIGHGHPSFGRYASEEGANPLSLSGGILDSAGGIARAVRTTEIKRTGRSVALAHTDGSSDQHGRGIARSIEWSQYLNTLGTPSPVVLPLEKGFTREDDFYPPHPHDAYRWSMAVDLDRCIGCGACVVACYAENNVAVVGKAQVIKGREMAWLHIQRYFEQEEPFVRFIPMLCQHCDEAPCESVCPVFAPNHSKEGINNQVYNRCIGTRYCSQNCPYKVRRFNWFTWKHDPPLEWQLNPDVTVRTKGVMEKCSFCIQRINEARIRAKSEKRLIRDNEFAPACAQTCPQDALVFGNLKDPGSRVARLVRESRAYQVLGELNTKPGVIYLRKITRSVI